MRSEARRQTCSSLTSSLGVDIPGSSHDPGREDCDRSQHRQAPQGDHAGTGRADPARYLPTPNLADLPRDACELSRFADCACPMALTWLAPQASTSESPHRFLPFDHHGHYRELAVCCPVRRDRLVRPFIKSPGGTGHLTNPESAAESRLKSRPLFSSTRCAWVAMSRSTVPSRVGSRPSRSRSVSRRSSANRRTRAELATLTSATRSGSTRRCLPRRGSSTRRL